MKYTFLRSKPHIFHIFLLGVFSILVLSYSSAEIATLPRYFCQGKSSCRFILPSCFMTLSRSPMCNPHNRQEVEGASTSISMECRLCAALKKAYACNNNGVYTCATRPLANPRTTCHFCGE